MTILKCKMCGGSLTISENERIAVCDYCRTKQTLPKLDDNKRIQLHDRANYFRRENEFDKAMGIYEMILSEDNTDSEAYWGIVLCRYGIEYVEDPRSHKRIPTVNRAQFTSIFEDENYKKATEFANPYQKEIYEEEASCIDKIQKGILSISQKEAPFDVFICYKETDSDGNRTPDSVYAQEIYTALIKEGYKVFFSRITLEDKLGSAYEPYIFAALNSARVMLVVGTAKENFNAVWVKNEWSRFISLIEAGKDKTLIPVYKDISPYDMPEEFQYLQSQDMGKIGYMQDLLRGIGKLVDTEKTTIKETVVINQGSTQIEPLLKRAFMFLEDGDFSRADEFCEQVLNTDPENAKSYLCKLLADLRVRSLDALSEIPNSFSDNNNYLKIMRFADKELKEQVKKCNDIIVRRNEENRKRDIYKKALEIMEHATTEQMFENAGFMFQEVKDYSDANLKSEQCFELGEEARKDEVILQAKNQMRGENPANYQSAITLLETVPGWKDADDQILVCRKRIEEIKAKAEAERLEKERRTAELHKIAETRAKKKRRLSVIIAPIAAVVLVFVIVLTTIIIPNSKYNDAVALMEEGKYKEAITAFEELNGAKDSAEMINECKYSYATQLAYEGKYKEALAVFSEIVDFKDSKTLYSDILRKTTPKEVLCIAPYHTIGLKSDGYVVSTEAPNTISIYRNMVKLQNWTDIIAISTGSTHTVGLKSDGTAVAVGNNYNGECNVSDWTDIVAISAGGRHTIGMKSDGTAIAVGYNEMGQCNVNDWTDIVAISAGENHTIGLKADGTVVATGSDEFGQCCVNGWTDIVAISAGYAHTVGLKSDGTVVATNFKASTLRRNSGQCNVKEWADIVAISAGTNHTVGLKSDGTVVATDFSKPNDFCDYDGQCDVKDWTDIVAVFAGSDRTLGLKSDGSVVAAGDNDDGACDVSDWKNIQLPDNK